MRLLLPATGTDGCAVVVFDDQKNHKRTSSLNLKLSLCSEQRTAAQ
jgi:hypothetical protein